MLCNIIQDTFQLPSAYQLCWGYQEMETAISCALYMIVIMTVRNCSILLSLCVLWRFLLQTISQSSLIPRSSPFLRREPGNEAAAIQLPSQSWRCPGQPVNLYNVNSVGSEYYLPTTLKSKIYRQHRNFIVNIFCQYTSPWSAMHLAYDHYVVWRMQIDS